MADRSVVYRLRAEVTQFRAQVATAGASVKKLGNDLTALDRDAAKVRRGMDGIGSAAGRMGAAATLGLGAVVVATANFEQAMSSVQAATRESAFNMEALREAAIKAGADTTFSASEAAAGIENLAKAGVSTQSILGGGLQGALDLAAAGTIEVADAAEVAATAMTQFGLQGRDVPHIADLLAAGAGKAQGEVHDLGMALNQSGLVAAQMGLSIEETTGALAAFASAGLLGSDAGTSLKTMLLRLANPSKEAAETMQRFGISAYDASGNLVSMVDLAGQLSTSFAGQSQATRDAALATIFGSDAIRAANVLYSQGARGIAEWTANVDDAGYAADVAGIKLDNLKGDVEALKGSLETALIGTGDGSQGMLRGFTQGLTGAVNAYNDLGPTAKSATGTLLATTAAVGGGVFVFSKLVQGIASTRQALDDVGPAATRAGRALRTGLAVGVVLQGVDLLGDSIDALFDTDLNTSRLGRSLDALASDRVAGELLSQYGKNLSGFAAEAETASQTMSRFWAAVDGVPLVGGALAAPVGASVGAVNNIKALDEALAQMVEGGRSQEALRIFQELWRASNLRPGDFNDLFTEFRVAMDNIPGPAGAAQDAIDGVTDATESNTASLRENVLAMAEQREARIEAANAEIAFQSALDDARKALKENGATLDITTEKGRANKLALLDLAAAWNDQSDATKRAGGAGRDMRREFIGLATDMGMAEAMARRLARRLLDIPARVTTEVVTTYRSTGRPAPGVGTSRAYATGGMVFGPGSGTSDSIPAWLSNGEFVVNAAATARHRALLEAINARGYAAGGMVTPHAAPAAAVGIDYTQLAQAMAAARPLYGDVHLTGDYSQFKREMQADQRRAAVGGF